MSALPPTADSKAEPVFKNDCPWYYCPRQEECHDHRAQSHHFTCCRQKKSVQFYRDIFGLECKELFDGHFLAVRINDSLTFDFADANNATPTPQHYAFRVSEQEFDEIFKRIKAHNISYSSTPEESVVDMKIYRHNGGRGVYFRDLDRNALEILTADYDDSKPFEYGVEEH